MGQHVSRILLKNPAWIKGSTADGMLELFEEQCWLMCMKYGTTLLSLEPLGDLHIAADLAKKTENIHQEKKRLI